MPSQLKAQKKKAPFEPTENYEVLNIQGWKVYVNRRLVHKESEVGRKSLALLSNQLEQITMLLPENRVKALQSIRIWLDDDPENQIHYHPEKRWLISNGYNPERAKCVDIGRADRFYDVRRSQPFVALHELAHGYHDQFLSFDDRRVIDAFETARDAGKYKDVLRIQGVRDKHYALTNHKEYFAESTEAFIGTNDFFPFVRAELKEHDPKVYRVLEEVWFSEVTEVPGRIRRRYLLSDFYQKYLDSFGIPIVASKKVRDEALYEANYLINRMLENRDDIRQAMIKGKTRFVIMAVDEFTTDIPEQASMKPKNYWDRRARGLGAQPRKPFVSCGEENLLAYPGDPYRAENILVHEFAHAIHHMGLDGISKDFDNKLKRVFDQAMAEGLWKGKYASTNRAEYWAEGVQSYFDDNRENDHDHNHVNTRKELEEYDIRLFELIDDVFKKSDWKFRHVKDRSFQVHLRTLKGQKLPRFSFPARLKEEAEKLKKKAKEQLEKAKGDSKK